MKHDELDEIKSQLIEITAVMDELGARSKAAQQLSSDDAKIIALNAISSEYREIDRKVNTMLFQLGEYREDAIDMLPIALGEPVGEDSFNWLTED